MFAFLLSPISPFIKAMNHPRCPHSTHTNTNSHKKSKEKKMKASTKDEGVKPSILSVNLAAPQR